MKRGNVILKIGGITFYYLSKDPCYTYNGQPCHYLTTDLKNKNCAFRVNPNENTWIATCSEIYKQMRARGEV